MIDLSNDFRSARPTRPLAFALLGCGMAGIIARVYWLYLKSTKMAPADLDEVEHVLWLAIAVVTTIGAAVGWLWKMPKK